MGARSGGGTAASGGLGRGDGWFSGDIKGEESLKNIKDKKLYNTTKEAISRFYKELGIPQRKVKLADLPVMWAFHTEWASSWVSVWATGLLVLVRNPFS